MQSSCQNQLKRFLLSFLLSIFYLVPLYHMLDEKDKFFFACSYLVYFLILSLFSIIIQLFTTQKIEQFQLEGEYQNSQRFFLIGKKICIQIGIISFLIIFLVAKPLSNYLIGKLALDVETQSFVKIFQISSITGLFLPIKSFYLGYFEGHKKEKEVKYAQIIEEGVKIIGMGLGSIFFSLLPNCTIPSKIITIFFPISVFIPYLYLCYQEKKKKKELERKTLKVKYQLISEKKLKQEFRSQMISYFSFLFFPILIYLVDFEILIEILPKKFSYSTIELERIFSSISCWSLALVIAIFSIFCIYFIQEKSFDFNAFFQKTKDLESKIEIMINKFLTFIIPITFFLIIEMDSIITILYEKNLILIEICIFQFLTMIFYFLFLFISLFQNDQKRKILINLTISFFTKIILTIPLITATKGIGLQAYSGASIATILGYGLGIFFSLQYLGKKYQLNFEVIIPKVFNSFLFSLGMAVLLILTKIKTTNKFLLSIYLIGLILVVTWGNSQWKKQKSKIK